MFKSFLIFLRDLLRSPSMHDSLEAYIVAGNPQDSSDIDRLEREFYQRHRAGFFEKYY